MGGSSPDAELGRPAPGQPALAGHATGVIPRPRPVPSGAGAPRGTRGGVAAAPWGAWGSAEVRNAPGGEGPHWRRRREQDGEASQGFRSEGLETERGIQAGACRGSCASARRAGGLVPGALGPHSRRPLSLGAGQLPQRLDLGPPFTCSFAPLGPAACTPAPDAPGRARPPQLPDLLACGEGSGNDAPCR